MPRILFTSRHSGDLTSPEWRDSLRELLGSSEIIFMNQSHGNKFIEVRSRDLTDRSEEFACDALITAVKGVSLAVMVADCLPVLLYAESIVAAVHVGRAGMINGIIEETVLRMKEMDSSPISATIGPAICRDCYQVSPNMYEEISTQFPSSRTSTSAHCLDLKSAVRAQLESLAVLTSQVEICTLENPDFFSFRRGGEKGRQVGVISL